MGRPLIVSEKRCCPGPTGFGPGPSLREVRHPDPGRPRAGRCRGWPRPTLRGGWCPAARHRHDDVAGSAPALVAGAWLCRQATWYPGRCRGSARPSLRDRGPAVLTLPLGSVAGVQPGPRCAWVAADKTIGGLGWRCRGSAPALVARRRCRSSRSPVATALPGLGPGPRCAHEGHEDINYRKARALPGFGPGPRCVTTIPNELLQDALGVAWGPAPALVARCRSGTA